MNKIIEVLQILTESPIGMFSTIFSLLLIAAWLLFRFARKVTRLDLSQKHLEEGHKEILKRIDQLSADMRDGFRKVDKRFEKVDERFEKLEQKMDERFESMDKKFDRKIENLSEKLDRNTEELRKDNANLRTDVRILQHDRHYTAVSVMKTKKNRPSNKRKAVASF
jgi:DNA anti-recombination protein RmuC